MVQHSPDLFSSDIGGTMRDEYKNLSSFGISHEDILEIFKKYFEQYLIWLKEEVLVKEFLRKQ